MSSWPGRSSADGGCPGPTGDDHAGAVAPAAQRVDQGLGDVPDDREPARHVAVQGAAADRQLRLVAGGQDQAAGLVGEACRAASPAPGPGGSPRPGRALVPAKGSLSTPRNASTGSAIRQGEQLDAEVMGQRLRVGQAVLRGEAGRHGHPDDPVALRKPAATVATRLESMPPDRPMIEVEAVLGHVVAGGADQRPVPPERLGQARRQRRGRGQRRGRSPGPG